MIKKTVIKCSCGNKIGEHLGLVKTEDVEFNLHKCTNCHQQIKTEKSEGLHYA